MIDNWTLVILVLIVFLPGLYIVYSLLRANALGTIKPEKPKRSPESAARIRRLCIQIISGVVVAILALAQTARTGMWAMEGPASTKLAWIAGGMAAGFLIGYHILGILAYEFINYLFYREEVEEKREE